MNDCNNLKIYYLFFQLYICKKKNLYEVNSCVNNDILNGVHILEYTVNLNCKCYLFFMIYKRNPNTESNDYKITVPI